MITYYVHCFYFHCAEKLVEKVVNRLKKDLNNYIDNDSQRLSNLQHVVTNCYEHYIRLLLSACIDSTFNDKEILVSSRLDIISSKLDFAPGDESGFELYSSSKPYLPKPILRNFRHVLNKLDATHVNERKLFDYITSSSCAATIADVIGCNKDVVMQLKRST